MVRGVFIDRATSGRMTFDKALDRYLREVTPTKRPTTQRAEKTKAIPLRKFFGAYSLAAISVDLVARYRDERLVSATARKSKATGKLEPLSPTTVRLELALLGHIFTTAIREWRIGLVQNPVANIRKPSAGKGRNRRLSADEERRLREAVEAYANQMLGWILVMNLTRSKPMRPVGFQQVRAARHRCAAG